MSLGVYFKKLHLVKVCTFARYSLKFALFSVFILKELIKSKPTWKLKHANPIQRSSEYLYWLQMEVKQYKIINAKKRSLSHQLKAQWHIENNKNEQESPAIADKPARRESLPKMLQFDVLTTLSLTIRLAVVASEICGIPRNSLKIQAYGVQGHPRSSILVSIESPCTTSY